MKKILHALLSIGFVFIGFTGFSQNVVISEIYGGGGNSGATHKNDFIELYNPTSNTISLVGWSVQYASATGTSWASTALVGSIAPGGYYLVQEGAGAGNGVTLPTADATGTLAMSATTGKVALVSSTTLLTGAVPTSPNVVDYIGFGPTATWFEGTATAVLTNFSSAERKIPCVDSNNNANDFKIATPTPQNTSSVLLPAGFTSTYPKIQSITSSGFQIITNLDNIGTTYFVIQASGSAPAPTSLQVRNGQDGGGNVLTSDFKGSIAVTTAGTEFSISPSNLLPLTAYDIYFVTERCILSVSPVLVQATTISAADLTPPNNVSGYPKVQTITSSGFQVATKIDEGGKTYFVVLLNGATAPTPAQVKAGQDGAGAALSANLFGQMTVASANTEYTASVTGLAGSTNYSVYFISEDIAPNLQTSVSQVDVITPVPPVIFTEDFNNCDGTASFSSYSVTGDQVWGCTDFGRQSKGIRMNGFLSSAVVNEDWLISPPLSLTNGPSISYYSQFSFAGNGLQLKISTDYLGTGSPSVATWTDLNGAFPVVAVGSTSTALADWTFSNVDLSAYANQHVFVAFVYTSTAAGAARWTLDEINVTNATASYLQTTPSALSFQTSGTSQSYVLKGINLQNDVTVTAPSNFDVSKDNATFLPSISFTATEANTQATVFVKFTAPGSTTDTYSGTITNVSTGVASKSVNVKGTDLSLTFDVATYNMEFFGTDVRDAGNVEFGPADDALQVTNGTTVLQTIGADIFGVEEISDDAAFAQLVANLPGYNKVVSPKWSYSFDPPDPNFPPQKVAFIYKTSTVQIISSRVMFSKLYDDIRNNGVTLPGYPTTSTSFWSSGRLPFMITADVTINGLTKRIRLIDIHSKSGSAPADYDRRKYDVQVLHDSLAANYPNDNIILVGDYNDNVEGSIYAGHVSTYKTFVDDAANFNVLTYPLSLAGAYSFPSSNSFLDHIIISNDLTSSYIPNSIYIEDPRNYVSNYSNTTSDHLPVVARFLLTKNDQTITFAQPAPHIYGDADFNLTASSTSLLGVTFASSDPSIASILGNTVTIHKAGTVDITASQVGNTSFNAAPDVVQSLVIGKANQSISFGPLTTKVYGDGTYQLVATSDSGLPVSFSSADPLSISINADQATILKAGTIDITATQAGNANYNAALPVVVPQVVNKADQTISFGILADKIFGDPPYNPGATTTSPLPIIYTSSVAAVATANQSTVTIVGVGNTLITATQPGDGNFNPATPAQQNLSVAKANQTITFGVLADKTVGDPAFNLTGMASSNLVVGYGTTSDKITLNANQVTIVKAGRATITASQTGNTNFNAAASVDQSFCIKPAKPTVAVSNQNTETPVLTSSASAGNQWYLNGTLINGATNATLNVTGVGVYKVQVKVDDCLSAFSNDTPIVFTGDIQNAMSNVLVYPNPVGDYLQITGVKNEITGSQVVDMMGKSSGLVLEKNGETYKGFVDHLGAGVYILRIQEGAYIYQTKFIKK